MLNQNYESRHCHDPSVGFILAACFFCEQSTEPLSPSFLSVADSLPNSETMRIAWRTECIPPENGRNAQDVSLDPPGKRRFHEIPIGNHWFFRVHGSFLLLHVLLLKTPPNLYQGWPPGWPFNLSGVSITSSGVPTFPAHRKTADADGTWRWGCCWVGAVISKGINTLKDSNDEASWSNSLPNIWKNMIWWHLFYTH